ncbi:MAG TPA: ABC transporter permease [Anaerolineales bacterium]|nr:ABC transporter permease [Anaerolineales bacterium]
MAVAELDRESLAKVKEESYLRVVWSRFRRHKLALVSMFVLIVIILACAFASVIAPYDPTQSQKDATGAIIKNALPSAKYIMGTDAIGRDVFSRLLYAGRISLMIAFVVTLGVETFGAFIGAISGFFGGWVDEVIQRTTEFFLTLPLLPLLLAFSALLRGINVPFLPNEWSSAVVIAVILIAFTWTQPARLMRGMVLSLRNQEFTEAARAMGLSDLGIILHHMIPNAMAPIIVSATLDLGGVIIYESALSFLGFGIQPPVPTWGNMLSEYQSDMWTQPAKVFYPGLSIFIVNLAFNYMGDALRDALDPLL